MHSLGALGDIFNAEKIACLGSFFSKSLDSLSLAKSSSVVFKLKEGGNT